MILGMPRLALLAFVVVAVAGCPEGRVRRPGVDTGPTPGTDTGPGTDVGPRPDAGPRPDVPPTSCETSAGMDVDMDGFPNPEDCNDCSAQINPGAYDFPGDGNDEDCSGSDATVAIGDCDRDLVLDSIWADEAARAIGLCEMTDEASRRWGVLSARWAAADGTMGPLIYEQFGFLPALGAQTARQGGAMLAISSGVARAPDQPGFTPDCDIIQSMPVGYPPGYPTPSPACPGVLGGPPHDSVALELRVRVPTNALSVSFLSAFFTTEYPDFICDEYNDFFVVLRQTPSGWENLVRDTMGNAVSVNNAFLAACRPGRHGGRTFACPLGTSFLAGTGYDGTNPCGYDPELGITGGVGASTGWLRTSFPVTPGEIMTLRFAIWDSGDPDLDSLALIDGWEWEVEPVDIIETEPILF